MNKKLKMAVQKYLTEKYLIFNGLVVFHHSSKLLKVWSKMSYETIYIIFQEMVTKSLNTVHKLTGLSCDM